MAGATGCAEGSISWESDLIFVTIGTTIPFDGLIREIDRAVAEERLPRKVVCQIGSGEFHPVHCKFFRYKPNLEQELDRADLVITHGGTGSVITMLDRGVPFLAVANPDAAGDHQREFLKKMGEEYGVFWTDSVREAPNLAAAAMTRPWTACGRTQARGLEAHILSLLRLGAARDGTLPHDRSRCATRPDGSTGSEP